MSNGQTDSSSLGSSVRVEMDELRMAMHTFEEDLLPLLMDGNLNFCEEIGPKYNGDKFGRGLSVVGNPYFPEGVDINIGEGKKLPVNQAHSLYTKSVLQDPVNKGYIRIDQVKVNPAYIFPKGQQDRFLAAKNAELSRTHHGMYGATNLDFSAFDLAEGELTMGEMLKLEYDGYTYELRKMINKKGEIKIFMQVGQRRKGGEIEKVLRRLNEVPNLTSDNFDGLNQICSKSIDRAKKISGIVKK